MWRMRGGKTILALLIAVILLPACGNQLTQEQQISQGEEVYQAECARCHEGGIGPALTTAVLGQRGDAQRLYDYVHTTMPQDKPGQLTDDEYWNVLAFVISRAELLPQDTVLSGKNAAEVNLQK